MTSQPSACFAPPSLPLPPALPRRRSFVGWRTVPAALLAAGLMLWGTAAPSAHAATITATFSDLILGFRATGGSGADKNLEVDLGNVGQFYALPAQTHFTIAGFSASDLADVYEVLWNTRDDLFWGLAATTGSAQGTTINSTTIASKTLWGTRAQSTAGVQSTPWNRANAFSQQGPANAMATLYTGGLGSLNGKTSTTNSTQSAVLDSATAGSWSAQEGSNAAAFGSQMSKSLFEAGTNFSTLVGSYFVLDLYELQPGSGSGGYIGSFGLDSAGLLQFSNDPAFFAVSAVPEPSAWAALLGAVALGWAAFRRRARAVPAAMTR